MEDPLAWAEDAVCKGVDQAYFFKDMKLQDGGVRQSYRVICKGCPVKSFCLEYALLYNMEGVWGGLSELERKRRYDREFRNMLIADAIESGVYISYP